MSRFIPIKTYHNGFVVDALVNIDHILMVWLPDYRDDMPGECFYHMTDGFTTEHAAEPYDSLVAKILAASTAKEKENLPPTPPIREKEVRPSPDTPARTREESDLTCGGMVVPTLDEVKAFAAANGIAADMAEDFHNYCDAMGWRHNGGVIYSWRAMLKAWQRARKRFAAKDAKLTAHIDAKMDAREAKRARQMQKRADNYIAPTEEQLKEVERDYTF